MEAGKSSILHLPHWRHAVDLDDQVGDFQMIHSPPSIFHLPMSSPDITPAEIEAVNQVLRTPYLSLGPCIAEFEERFAAYACPEPGRRVGARHAVGVSSGTAGLHLCVTAALRGERRPFDKLRTSPEPASSRACAVLSLVLSPSAPLGINSAEGLVEGSRGRGAEGARAGV